MFRTLLIEINWKQKELRKKKKYMPVNKRSSRGKIFLLLIPMIFLFSHFWWKTHTLAFYCIFRPSSVHCARTCTMFYSIYDMFCVLNKKKKKKLSLGKLSAFFLSLLLWSGKRRRKRMTCIRIKAKGFPDVIPSLFKSHFFNQILTE